MRWGCLEVSGGFLLLAAFLYYMDTQGVVLWGAAACALHEGGHYLAIRLLGGSVEDTVDYTIPHTDVTHRVLVIRKVSPTPAKYPRRFAQIKKQPL